MLVDIKLEIVLGLNVSNIWIGFCVGDGLRNDWLYLWVDGICTRKVGTIPVGAVSSTVVKSGFEERNGRKIFSAWYLMACTTRLFPVPETATEMVLRIKSSILSAIKQHIRTYS